MKLIIFALFLVSCASVNPVQVYRTSLTIDRIETRSRYPLEAYYAIWVDVHGNEFSERIIDTTAFRRGLSFSQLLKR